MKVVPVRKAAAILIFVMGISACASPTLHSTNSPLPSSDALVSVIDGEHEGSAAEFIQTTFYRESEKWTGGHVLWAHQMYAQKNRQDLLRALQSRGWDVNTPSNELSYLPLRLAIESGSTAAVKSLLAVGADPDLLDRDCSKPCIMCQNFSRYLCSSALSLVVLAGKPAMLQPVLGASEMLVWHEMDHLTGVSGERVTGKNALAVGVDRAFELGRGEAFAQAFADAGYSEQVAIARNAQQTRRAAPGVSSATSTANANSGDSDLANAGMAAAVGLGLGALLGGETDVVSAVDMAQTVIGASGTLDGDDTKANVAAAVDLARTTLGAGDSSTAGSTDMDSAIGAAQAITGASGSSGASSAETEMVSFFLQTLANAAAEGAKAEKTSIASAVDGPRSNNAQQQETSATLVHTGCPSAARCACCSNW